MSILAALDEVARIVSGCGEFRDVSAITPGQVADVPAWFPDAIEEVEAETQSGERTATVPFWLLVPTTTDDHKRALYRLVDRVWDVLSADVNTVQRVVRLSDVGSVTLGDDTFWGGKVTVLLWV